MGKMIQMVSLIVMIDMFFLVTGQLTGTLTSLIFESLLQIGQVSASEFFTNLIGNASNLTGSTVGLLSLLSAGAVVIGAFLATREIQLLFIPMTGTLAFFAMDFVSIYNNNLRTANPVLAVMIMAPIILIYFMVAVEWLRGKD